MTVKAIVLGDVDLDGDVDAIGITSQAATLTDRDRDGDPDLLIITNAFEGAVATAFLNHTGGPDPLWDRDVAPEVHADVALVAMGVDSGDLNGDGAFDYCASDLGPPTCLMSDGVGGYFNGGAAAGLSPDSYPYSSPSMSGWSMDFADVDADGNLDVLHASRWDRYSWELGQPDHPDLLWMGLGDGLFDDASVAVGWDDVEAHYGMAVGDVDGDGFVDAVLAGPWNPPRLQRNRCGTNAWLEVVLSGGTRNTTGIGAIVEAHLPDGRVLFREVLGPRAQGQGPGRVHFGLGDVEVVDRLVVRWPDSTPTELEDVPVRRRIRAFGR